VIPSRRQFLACLGLALPAVTVVATEAKASLRHHRHKARHLRALLAAHRRRHRPGPPSLSQS